MTKLQTFSLIHFRGKSRLEDDGTWNYLVFQTVYKCFKTVTNGDKVLNIDITLEINLQPFNVIKDFTLGSSLFRAAKLSRYTDPGKYYCSG